MTIQNTLHNSIKSQLISINDLPSGEISYYMSPLFIENAKTIWGVQKNGNYNYTIVYSDNYGQDWNVFVALPFSVEKIPASIYIHSTRHIFIAEDVPPNRSARVFRVDRTTKEITIARYLDPSATISPWGWTSDADGILFAGQYGFGSLSETSEEFGLNARALNISYILQIADAQGNSVSRNDDNSISNWSWPPNVAPETNFATWLAPRGVIADRHVHNLSFDVTRNKFFINGGDSPRSFMYWGGDMETRPVLAQRTYEMGILGGFTGCAPLSDGIYVADDWTVAGRGNSIRKYQLTNKELSYVGVIATLPNSWDTPIFDLHATTDGKKLFFVNYDEPRLDEPAIRFSGLHSLSRDEINYDFTNFSTLFYRQSSFRNWQYIAADLNGQIPFEMPYIFIWGKGTFNGEPVTVIARVKS